MNLFNIVYINIKIKLSHVFSLDCRMSYIIDLNYDLKKIHWLIWEHERNSNVT